MTVYFVMALRSPRVDRAGRGAYVLLAVGTIAAGLTVHWSADALSPSARDVLGDALWASMMYWWLGALMPGVATAIRAWTSLGVCFAVETSQLLHTASLDAFRHTTPGHLLLGNGFDPRDFAAYTAGVAAAWLLERTLLERRIGSGLRR